MSIVKNANKVDENVHIPAAIRAAAARSEALFQANHAPTGEQKETQAEEPDTKEPDTKEPAAAKEQKETQAKEPAAKEPTASQEGQEQDGDWEHKYLSLKGRFDRQDGTIRGLNSRISQLEGLLSEASSKPAEAKPQNPDLQFKPISDEERETYGEDFLDVAARSAASHINPQVEKLQRQIAELQNSIGSVAQKNKQTDTENMYSYLDAQMPTWKEVNRNPSFIAWCNLPDPFSGVIRMKMLSEAHAQANGARVLNFFKGFLADEAAMDPAGTVKPEMPKQGKVPLETFAAPGRAKAPAAGVRPGEKETISHAQISQFYADVNRGKYRGNDAEKQRLEAMIFEAQADGRVVS